MNNNNFLRKIYLTLKDSNIKNGDTLILGVSGGYDSTALLLGLANIKNLFKLKIIPVHVNHMLRGSESDRDEKFAKNISNRSGFKFISKSIDVKKMINNTNSIEEISRNIRYEFLQEVSEKYKAKGILTAHTQNDQAETVLMNIIRGSGLNGISGMKPLTTLTLNNQKVINLYRLMLNITHKECKKFCESLGVIPMFDSSNLDEKKFRNQIRTKTMPIIEKDFPNFTNKLSSLSENANQDLILKNWITNQYYDSAVNSDLSIKRKYLTDFPNSLISNIVIKHINCLTNKRIDFKQSHISEIIRIIKSNKNGEINLPNKIKIVITTNKVRIIWNDIDLCPYPLPIISPIKITKSKTKIGENYIITKNIIKRPKNLKNTNRNFEVYIRSNLPSKGLQLRNRMQGDLFHPLGMEKKVNLKDFMMKNYISSEWRERVPILSYSDKIVWVPGTRPAEWAKVQEKANTVLHIKISKVSEFE